MRKFFIHSNVIEPNEHELLAPYTTPDPQRATSSFEDVTTAKAKVVVQRRAYPPLLQLLVHVLAIASTAIILLLGLTNVYFADLTRPNLNVYLNLFQFVARFHEILIAISLGSIVMYHLRYELCAAQGLPYGFITSGFQLSAPQFLTTKSFWKVMFAAKFTYRTAFTTFLILLSALLIGLSGPSSAILLVPEVDWWPMKDPFSHTGGRTFLVGNAANIWPDSITSDWITDFGCQPGLLKPSAICPYAFMTGIAAWVSDFVNNQVSPNITVSQISNGDRYLSANYKQNWTEGYSVASTAMGDLTRALANIYVYAQRNQLEMANLGRPQISMSLTGEKQIMKPLVQVQCSEPYDITKGTSVNVVFPSDELVGSQSSTPYSGLNMTATIQTPFWRNRTDLQFGWYGLPQNNDTPALGALLAMTFLSPENIPTFSKYNDSDVVRGLIACTIDTRWTPTSMSLDPVSNSILGVSDPDPATIVTSQTKMSTVQDLFVDISYASALNAPVNNTSPAVTVMEFSLQYLEVVSNYFDGGWGTRWPWMVATTISLQMADALARLSYDDGNIIVWKDDPSHPNKFNVSDTMNLANMDYWGGVYHYPAENTTSFPKYAEEHPNLFTEVHWDITRFGYAWSFRRTTSILAGAVILVHVVIVLCYALVFVVRRWHSEAWDTLIDLFALAFLSPPPKTTTIAASGGGVISTSTGLDHSSRMYARMVRIRESENGRSAILAVVDNHNNNDDGYHDVSGEGLGVSTSYDGAGVGAGVDNGANSSAGLYGGRLVPGRKYL